MIDELKTTDPVEQHRFYFHINNGSRYPDEMGSVFSSADNAAAHAAVVAQELAQDESWSGFFVVVTDGRGREIGRVPIGYHAAGRRGFPAKQISTFGNKTVQYRRRSN